LFITPQIESVELATAADLSSLWKLGIRAGTGLPGLLLAGYVF